MMLQAACTARDGELPGDICCVSRARSTALTWYCVGKARSPDRNAGIAMCAAHCERSFCVTTERVNVPNALAPS